MTGAAERIDGIPPASEDVEAIYLYGVDLEHRNGSGELKERNQRALVYGFCFQGHCYRLSIPAEYNFRGFDAEMPLGCGFTAAQGYSQWRVSKTTAVTRIEKRGGTAEELVLDFNLPGKSPASLTYSAKVAIASNAGKVYE